MEQVRKDAETEPTKLEAGNGSIPLWLKNDKKVLQFGAYFKEAVDESSDESYRVRKCQIFFYLEDGTIHISEPRVENSGIPQGKFVKRHMIPKADGGYFTLDDLRIGREVTIYGRTFYIYSMNGSTRSYLEGLGVESKADESAPKDVYTSKRDEFMQRETGADQSLYRGVLMNPMKRFVEARLGKATNSNLDGFLKYDRKVLRFECVWDDRHRAHGLLHRYFLHYYMMDDTVEIVERHERNSGCYPFPKLLSRKRLPKDPDAYVFVLFFSSLPLCLSLSFLPTQAHSHTHTHTHRYKHNDIGENENDDNMDFYRWSDFKIGMTCLIFGRNVTILDCDASTRMFYKEQGIPLAEGRPFPYAPKRKIPKNPIPPHNGIGSEEDSLGAINSLIPKAPRRDLDKLQKLAGKMLRYRGKLVSDRVDDKDRMFVITYYLADDTIGVFEPPKRNSGIVGGKFLKRQRMKNSRKEYFRPGDFFVGATLVLGGYMFKIESTDNYTLSYMENRRELFPMANINKILAKLGTVLYGNTVTLEEEFRKSDTDSSGEICVDEFRALVTKHIGKGTLTEQEILTLMRFFDTDGSGKISYKEFSAKIQDGRSKFEMTKAVDLEKYEAQLKDVELQDIETQYQVKAVQYFKKIVEDRMGDMKQAFRMADTSFQNKLSADRTAQVMCDVLGMEPIDAKRVLVSTFGHGVKEVMFELFVKLCDV